MELGQRTAGPVVILDITRPSAEPIGAHSILRDRVRSLLDEGHAFILLNVADATYVDSVLLSAIVQGYASAVRQGGEVKLVHVTPRLRTLLKITKLEAIIESYESEDAAIASFPTDPT